MVDAAPDGDRVLLEGAPAGGRLAGVDEGEYVVEFVQRRLELLAVGGDELT